MPNLWTKRDGEKNWTTGPRNALYDSEVETTPTRLREGRSMQRPSSNTATASNGPTSVRQIALRASAPTKSAAASTSPALAPATASTVSATTSAPATTQAAGAESRSGAREEASRNVAQAPIFLDDADLILDDGPEPAADDMDSGDDDEMDVERELEAEGEGEEQEEVEPEQAPSADSEEPESTDYLHRSLNQMAVDATIANPIPISTIALPMVHTEEDRVLQEQMRVLRERLGHDRVGSQRQQVGPALQSSVSPNMGHQQAHLPVAQPQGLRQYGHLNGSPPWNAWPSTYPAPPTSPPRPRTYPHPDVQPARPTFMNVAQHDQGIQTNSGMMAQTADAMRPSSMQDDNNSVLRQPATGSRGG